MNAEFLEFIKIVIGSGGLLALGVIFFRTGKIVEKVENIEKRIEKLEGGIQPLTIAITKIEVRLEERSPNKTQTVQQKEIPV